MQVRWSPLREQFANPEPILSDIRELVASGDFTLGKVVEEFERAFAENIGTAHAIGVGSGTDALKLALRACCMFEFRPGAEVITSANGFWATAGAIIEAGGKPVFVDCDESFQIDASQIKPAITKDTVAVVPVHLYGEACDMRGVLDAAKIGRRRRLVVIEDACQSQGARWGRYAVGSWGTAGAFSLHPLKILNVWGDAGVVVTHDGDLAGEIRELRNHGLRDRDTMVRAGCNSRLDSLQAIVGKHVLKQHEWIIEKRRANAALYDEAFANLDGLRLPKRRPESRGVFLYYPILTERRDTVLEYLLQRGIEAKVHYPVPLYRQPALGYLGYRDGQFPVADMIARESISLPVDQHLTDGQLNYVVETVRGFFQ